MTTPGGNVINYSYDVAWRLKAVQDFTGGITNFSYDSAGRRTSMVFPNGAFAEYNYDPAGRLISLVHKAPDGPVPDSYTYTPDNVENRLTKATPGNTATSGYDNIYRLLDAAYSSGGPTKLQDES
jgi:YD repeat-containing protein